MSGSRGGAVMVVVQRNEVSRNRLLYILTIILSAVVLSAVAVNFSRSSEAGQVLLGLLAPIAFVAVVLSLVQRLTHPKRSRVLLFQRDDEIVVAINAVHEGIKLRLLRDILGDQFTSFTEAVGLRGNSLEND